ncbi:MAG: isochorismate synthase [Ilumatobacter sp.]|nr:isochorismate synthase [Ilumatobacter sp.]
MTAMRAVTRPLTDLAPDATALPDLNDVAAGDGTLFVRDGVGVAGRGVATRVPIDEATEVLRAIDHTSFRDDIHPIAIGTVPFTPGSPGELIIPRVVVGKRADGVAWLTTIDDADPADALALRPDPVPTATRYSLGHEVPIETYLAAVAAARDAVRRDELTKAVIARPIDIRADRPIDVHAVLRRLKASFGSSYRYSIDGLVGASPELLVEVDGPTVRSHPLAGTTRRTGDPANDFALARELQASAKNQIEHRVVIDVVHDTLLPWASYLDWEPEPSIVAVANVQHLGTRMEGMLSQPGPSVIELVRALAPTPALGGHPRAEALALIDAVEGFERGRYGGAVGWVDGHGNGTWAVTIRCAELSVDRRSARLVAGGGIVAGSDPHAELAETQAKFQAMISAIVRP